MEMEIGFLILGYWILDIGCLGVRVMGMGIGIVVLIADADADGNCGFGV